MSHALTSRQRHIKAASSVDPGVFYSMLSAGMILARRYLTGRGIDQEFADRYGSAFGRTAAKIYRTAHGAEPRHAWSFLSGKWRRVNGYLPTDTDVRDEAFTTYKRTAEYVLPEPASVPSPVEEYVKAAGDFPSRFEPVTGGYLRGIEEASTTDAVSEEMERILAELDAWKRAIDRYDAAMAGEVDQAAGKAMQALPWDDPRRQAWLIAERGMEAYLNARDIVNAAYVDWSFDLTGTVEIPETPRRPAPVIAEGCRIPGCDGTWHYDGQCVAQLGEVKFDGNNVALPAELVSAEDGSRHIVAFAFDLESLNMRREMRDRVSACNFANQMRRLADSIDDASAHLPAAS